MLVFILLLESAFALHSSEVVSSTEVVSSGQIKDMELISYNVMLDFCLQFKRWAVSYQNMTDPNTLQSLNSDIAVWSANIINCVDGTDGQIRLNVVCSDLKIVQYDVQPYDKCQMGYIGVSGNESWFVSGVLTVTVGCTWFSRVSTYNISIIC